MKKLLILFFLGASYAMAQDKALPYYEIPDYPEKYTAGTVAARMVDGLGFRFYWATEGLRPEDLNYKPSEDARTALETIEHIYEMSAMIRNATQLVVNVPGQSPKLPFHDMRKATLENFKIASDKLRASSDQDLKKYDMIYKNGDQKAQFPFWNHINGPIADCLWHVGQVVTFRRSSGNPFSEKVSVLQGKVSN